MNATQFYIGGASGSSNPQSQVIERSFAHPSTFTTKPFCRNEFGTLTTALAVVVGPVGIFIDNGSGMQNVNQFFKHMPLTDVYGLQTHFHLDHRSGIQMNELLFKKNLVRQIFAPKLGPASFTELFAQDFAPETWPISPATFGIKHEIVEFVLGSYLSLPKQIETMKLTHPGDVAGYRIETPEGAIVIATDNELSLPADQTAFATFVSGAEILYADVQYREREYRGHRGIGNGPPLSRKGWGHSTPEMLHAALMHCATIPHQIIIGHHDPLRSDEDAKHFEGECQKLFADMQCSVRFARDGDCITLN